ncbi:MAG: ABC transporter ATP-binding protein/permease [Treponema sp.]|nr:ABC transporter ATP-binding protein/permease [Treponema sp.]
MKDDTGPLGNFRYILGSVSLVLNYARFPCVLNIVQKSAAAVSLPLSVYFTRQVIKHALDIINNGVAISVIVPSLVWLFVVILFQESGSCLDSIIAIMLKRDMDRHFTGLIADKYRTIDYRYFEDPAAADAMARVGQEPWYKVLEIYQRGLESISILASLIGTSLVIAGVSPLFSLLFFVFVVVQVLLSAKAIKDMNTMFSNQSPRERELDYLSGLLEQKDPVFELKLFGSVRYILDKWKGINRQVLGERLTTTIKTERYGAAGFLLIIAWTVFVFVYLLDSLGAYRISIDVFIAVIVSLNAILGLSDSLSWTFSEALRKCVFIKYYDEFMRFPNEEEAIPHVTTTIPENADIEFRHVSFTYPGTEQEILRDVSFTIQKGQRLALVGENGAGKSTIIKLLLRLYKPDRGEILVGGVNLNDIPRSGIRKLFSAVFQDYAFYSLSLRENTAFGDIAKLNDDGELRRALAMGMADDLVSLSSKGLDTNLGKIEDDGIDLSGGQKQRLAISRACAGDGAFIILDEPTASMDPAAESRLYETFAGIMRGRGCVMVSHRMASARLADRIILVDKGRIAEAGSHGELMERKGLYAEMYRKQAEWYGEER